MKQLLSLLFILVLSTSIYAQWEQLNDIPFITDHSNGFGVNGKAYILQGTKENLSFSNQLWEYDPIDDEWKELVQFSGPARSIAIGDDMDGKYYFGFGNGDDGRLSDVWVFDPVDTSFTELPGCPCIGRSHPAFVAHNNKIFMGSGSSANGDLNDWWVLDLDSGIWSEEANIPGPERHHPYQFGIDGGIYVGGGHIANWSRYDIETRTWSDIDDYPGGRVAGTQFSHDGKGYVLSGDDASHGPIMSSQLFLQYDPEDNIWRELPPHPGTNKWACSSFIIDNFIYLFGGYEYESTEYGNEALFKFNLGKLACLAPSGLNAVNVSDSSADLFWSSNSNGLADTLKYRKVGEENWTIVADPQVVYPITQLEACQDYEFTVVTECDTLISDYAQIFEFRTDGCCLNPELEVNEISETAATISWEGILAANEYEIRWSRSGENDWESTETNALTHQLLNLESCTEYEFQIRTICDDEMLMFSASLIFRTRGCGVCIDAEYCSIDESYTGDFFYLEEIQLAGYTNTSGNNGGYGNFEDPDAINLTIGEEYNLIIIPGFEGEDDWGQVFSVFMDFNGDGDFSGLERVFYDPFGVGIFSDDFIVPSNATPGLTRMRIIVGWDDNIGACEPSEFFVGEVEDYCITLNVESDIKDSAPLSISVYPNPFNDLLYLDIENATISNAARVELTDLMGRTIINHSLDNNYADQSIILNTQDLSNGIYTVNIIDKTGTIIQQEKVVHLK